MPTTKYSRGNKSQIMQKSCLPIASSISPPSARNARFFKNLCQYDAFESIYFIRPIIYSYQKHRYIIVQRHNFTKRKQKFVDIISISCNKQKLRSICFAYPRQAIYVVRLHCISTYLAIQYFRCRHFFIHFVEKLN